MSHQTDGANRQAIVIGASIGGLLAARVLADHFGQVTLLERDTFPEPGENRKGVPQGQHTHLLLERGRAVMEGYLPGLTDELAAVGAVIIPDASRNVRWFHNGRYHQPGDSGIKGVGVARPTLEARVRARVLALPNIRAREDCNVLGLLTTPDRCRVTGVRLVDRRAESGEETMSAGLVVDASGRGSRSPAWLEEVGYARPDVEEVRIGMGYTTCYYPRRPEQVPGILGIAVIATPSNPRLGVMLVQDGDRWVVTVGGYLGDHAPIDYPGFLDAVRRLPTPDIYHVVKGLEPLGMPVAYKFPANLRHRYDQLDRFPDGYLVTGDALCSFNPIYGQGMTVAALEAEALEECLAGDRGRLAGRFFAKTGKIIDIPWSTAVGADLSFPAVEGPRTPMVRFLNWYVERMHIAAHHDAQVSIAFLKVTNMLAPPPSILHPRIVWRVVKGNLWRGEPQQASDKAERVSSPEFLSANRP